MIEATYGIVCGMATDVEETTKYLRRHGFTDVEHEEIDILDAETMEPNGEKGILFVAKRTGIFFPFDVRFEMNLESVMGNPYLYVCAEH